jgi:hypothetical protein
MMQSTGRKYSQCLDPDKPAGLKDGTTVVGTEPVAGSEPALEEDDAPEAECDDEEQAVRAPVRTSAARIGRCQERRTIERATRTGASATDVGESDMNPPPEVCE